MSEKDISQRFRIAQKMQMVMSANRLKEEDLGRFLRKHGIRSAELNSWRSQMQGGLEDGRPVKRSTQKKFEEEIAQLQEENRKLRVINEFQKKMSALFEEAAAPKTKPQSKDKRSKTSAKSLKKKA